MEADEYSSTEKSVGLIPTRTISSQNALLLPIASNEKNNVIIKINFLIPQFYIKIVNTQKLYYLI